MFKVIGCFAGQHDTALAILAVITCLLACYTAVDLIHHAKTGAPNEKRRWLLFAGFVGGVGIWATHFIAMMAFDTGLPTGYDMLLTGASFLTALAFTSSGCWLALRSGSPAMPWIGGAVVGLGLAAMHHVGLAAYVTTGRIQLDPGLATLAVALGLGLAAWSIALKVRGGRSYVRTKSALLLVSAVCTMHFVSMASITVAPDPTMALPVATLSRHWLAVLVGGASLGILGNAAIALTLDTRERLRREQFSLVLSLANAAVEGILVCEDNTVIAANENFAALIGQAASEVIGRPLSDIIPRPPGAVGHAAEQELVAMDGSVVPVEVIRHEISLQGRHQHAIAVRDLRARRYAEDRIRHLAHHDVLTGLPNRASFTARLEEELALAKTGSRSVALLFLDLDRFKEVNDTFGHAAGDELLLTVARAVTSVLDPDQMLARLGGDEFAVILPGLTDATTAARVAGHIIETVRAAADSLPAGGVIGTSVGIAVYPHDALDRSTLLNHADLALYQAKADGRGVYRFFQAAMGEKARERRLFERDLRLALERDEFYLAYQPQKSVRTGAVTGFEALLRWRHPLRGEVAPADFIPIAEESGLIHAIGAWVLRCACREMIAINDLRVAVNVSALQIHSANFAGLVRDVLAETRFPPDRLEIEVTETALIRDFDRALTTLRQIKALGAQVTMDDFGTGYSSLSHLKMFPFDRIKIDRSFVRAVDQNHQGAAIVRAVLGLGRGLGLPVLAEGVETAEEFNFLDAEACDEVQGYFLGRPEPLALVT